MSVLNRYNGIILATCSGVLNSGIGGMSRYLEGFSSHELVVCGMAFSSVFSIPSLFCGGRNLLKTVSRKQIMLLVLISLIRFSGVTARVQAFKMMPLGDATAIAFNLPMVTALLARLTLKERVGRLTLISLLASLVGTFLTAKLPLILSSSDFSVRLGSVTYLKGCGFAVFSVFACSGIYVVGRGLKDSDPCTNVFLQGILVLVIGACISPLLGGFHLPSCSPNTWIVLAFCASMFSAVTITTIALQKEKAVVVSTIIRSTDIFLAFLMQIFFFGEVVDGYSASGAIVIVLSGLILPLETWMKGLPAGNPWKIQWMLK